MRVKEASAEQCTQDRPQTGQLRDTPAGARSSHLTAGHVLEGSFQNVLEQGRQQPLLDLDHVLQGEQVECLRQVSWQLLKLLQCASGEKTKRKSETHPHRLGQEPGTGEKGLFFTGSQN